MPNVLHLFDTTFISWCIHCSKCFNCFEFVQDIWCNAAAQRRLKTIVYFFELLTCSACKKHKKVVLKI